ncbi:decarboxylating 6-phosphogluconate dehydrogenase [Nocardia higoensis]|uniref:Decarboxylating 6-phosphogluconate dehydrogenase n=1 Tax=Nocardia higoensis TaxID=228599 RepID=A0ABS0DEH5_9NOCA|nr:decarboxylating 6-phosphogluconate dehydrogenase [Nocardia higoensis]MBF6356540.1 decarboxylating 6-phosphogluconate dehydrogenase [Nocardia higoensis]
MQLGMIGLGRMGGNIVRRIVRAGHTAVGYERRASAIEDLRVELGESFQGSTDLREFVAALTTPRVVWVMIPAGATGAVIDELAGLLDPGDIVIDGGNSRYHDDIARARQLAPKGIHYVDVGTSGGVFGLERGFCLMIGGDSGPVAYLDPLWKSIAPGVEAAPRTPGRTGEPSPAEHGYLHCGPPGAGHFVKMVHNGIEYGAMAAYAEGLNILHKADYGLRQSGEFSAEETPLAHPELYRYQLDVPEVTEVWRRGSVVASWLLDLTAGALHADPNLDSFGGRVSDSGEGRWTLDAAIDVGVPAPVLAAALFGRFSSRGEALYADKVLSAMRLAFGGHDERPAR